MPVSYTHLDVYKRQELLDEIKAQLPAELEEAKRLVSARTEFIANAKREAESIRKVAEERARQLVDEQEVYRAAKTKSSELLSNTEKKVAELRQAANTYADDALRRTEDAITEALNEVHQSRVRFHNVSASIPSVHEYTDAGDLSEEEE